MAGKGEGGSNPRMSAGYPGASTGPSEESKGLKESAQEMASHLGESAGQVRDKAREFVSGVAGQAQEAWRSAREGVQERYSDLSGRTGDIWEDGIELIRRHPMASMAVAFGLGCLVSCAWMTMPRSSDDIAERMSRGSS